MEPSSKQLRPYQVRLVTDVCRATEDVLVEQPTGSGKTVQIVTLVAMHLGQRFSHAVISAPQEQIEQGGAPSPGPWPGSAPPRGHGVRSPQGLPAPARAGLRDVAPRRRREADRFRLCGCPWRLRGLSRFHWRPSNGQSAGPLPVSRRTTGSWRTADLCIGRRHRRSLRRQLSHDATASGSGSRR